MDKQADERRLERLRSRIREFPTGPGLYVMKDTGDKVLYIGKAKNLRSRVASYFQPSADLSVTRSPKIQEMADLVDQVDILETPNEVDAILKEARLIKDIRPPYNTQLMDDKTFPYLEITTREDFPGIYVTRKPKEKGTRLFGPFTAVSDLRGVLVMLQKIYKFRTCTLEIRADDPKRRFFRPCLLYSINQCTAPCAAKIDPVEYKKSITDVLRFLRSKRSAIIRDLNQKMIAASQNRHYEKAAMYRDRLKLIESLEKRGTVDGNVQPEAFASDPTKALVELKRVLELPQDVRIIEGMDIAHLQGSETVGSLVKFIDGRPFKDGYRRFRIQTVKQVDDYASLAEVIRRRYKYALQGEELWPDLILIDGGLGQLNSALKSFHELLLEHVTRAEDATLPQTTTLISLAKKEELIYRQGWDEPVRLTAHSPARKLLQYVRDESHRFAQHYHHLLRSKQVLPDS